MTNPIANNVLDFWFGERPLSIEHYKQQASRWFAANQDFDYDIERRFGKLVSTARQGAFDAWSGQPQDCLALILLLDQFPRNLYRGQAGAFASDDKALALTRSLCQSGAIEQLGYAERGIALMPYQHSEDLEVQKEAVQAYQQQADSAPEEWKGVMQGYQNFAQQHLDIIQQFGRFPHRNAVLGRNNTPEEQAYLSSGGKTFGQ